MRRLALAMTFLGLFALSAWTLAGAVHGYSDGIAGASGAVAVRFRTCPDPDPNDDEPGYCKITPSLCGGCHGDRNDMMQESPPHGYSTPQERVSPDFMVEGDDEAGSVRGQWTYVPGQSYRLDVRLDDERPEGQYNSGGFNLNASAGVLSLWNQADETVRITGGVYPHQGSKNPDAVYDDGRRVGQVTVDESEWAGEATHTAKGGEERSWTIRWTAPLSSETPRGVAFVMTVMLPDGDGLHTCTREQCNGSQPYKPQDQWDWYGFMVPRRIMCEEGAYATFGECQDAVIDFILPPPPPINTCPTDDPDCSPNEETTGGGAGTPAPGAAVMLVGAAAATALFRRARPPKRSSL